MRPLPKKILVAVDLQQRRGYEMKFGALELWMDSEFGEDGKVTRPCLAQVVAAGEKVDGIEAGVFVLCHFNTFASFLDAEETCRYGQTGEKDEQGRDLFAIDPERVLCYVGKDGRPVPAEGKILVNRLPDEIATTLVVPDSVQKTDMHWFEVEKLGLGNREGYKPGDWVYCYRYSDLKVLYTFEKKAMECFVVKVGDVLAWKKGDKKLTLENLNLVV